MVQKRPPITLVYAGPQRLNIRAMQIRPHRLVQPSVFVCT